MIQVEVEAANYLPSQLYELELASWDTASLSSVWHTEHSLFTYASKLADEVSFHIYLAIVGNSP